MAMQFTMSGGSPWGFKMTGGRDFHLPLAIGQVKPGGKAAKSGVVQGYVIEKVNGEEVTNLSHHEAQNKIKTAGFSLTLTLSKPKPRETPADVTVPAPAAATTKPRSPSAEYRADASRLERYSDPGKWQKEGGVSQSPALYSKTRAYTAPRLIEDEPTTLSITPEIKAMIEEEELNKQNAALQSSSVKASEPQNVSPPGPSPKEPSTNGHAGDKSKAASNIGKFFQSSAAPRYGEPTFSKPLQDVTKPMGDPAVLEVRIGTNLPVPTVHWYHNNKPVRESKEKDVRFLNNGPIHTLVIGELTPELLGNYTCTIINKNGSKSCRCQVAEEGGRGRRHSNYGPSAVHPPTTTADGRRVVPSTSRGLYSNKSAQESYHAQVSRKTSRDSNEESEVMKALREEAPQKNNYKTPSMKFLADSLLTESEDL